MRHDAQPELTEQVHVDAEPEAIWPIISDITLPVDPSAELQAVEWADAGVEPAVGRCFVGTNRNRHFGEWQMPCTVIECDEPNAFAWVAGDVTQPATTWRFSIEADSDGSIVRQWMKLGVGESGLSIAIARMPEKQGRIIERRLAEFRTGMVANLEAIRAAVAHP